MFGKQPGLSRLETRRQLLVAESELNRAQLSEDCRMMTQGLRDFAHRANRTAVWASTAALLVGGVTAWRRGGPARGSARSTWFRTLLTGVRVAATAWSVFHSRAAQREHNGRVQRWRAD